MKVDSRNIYILGLVLFLLAGCRMADVTEGWPVQKRRYMPGWHLNMPGRATAEQPKATMPALQAISKPALPRLPALPLLPLTPLPRAQSKTAANMPLPASQAAPPDSTGNTLPDEWTVKGVDEVPESAIKDELLIFLSYVFLMFFPIFPVLAVSIPFEVVITILFICFLALVIINIYRLRKSQIKYLRWLFISLLIPLILATTIFFIILIF